MNHDDLRRILTAATDTVEPPDDEFVARLRRRLDAELRPGPQSTDHHGGIMVLDLDDRPPEATPTDTGNRRLILLGVAAAVVLVVVLATLLQQVQDGRTVSTADDPPGTVADSDTTDGDAAPAPEPLPTEPIEVGEAWLQSIVDNDRETFVALHAPEFTANDTLIMAGTLRLDEVPDHYFDGFDAFAISLAVDGDQIQSDGCEEKPSGHIGCGFAHWLVGQPDKLGTVQADLTVVDGLITDVRLVGRPEPDDLMGLLPLFLNTEATTEDLECLTIGFNSLACGEQHSDLLRRYFDYRDQQFD